MASASVEVQSGTVALCSDDARNSSAVNRTRLASVLGGCDSANYRTILLVLWHCLDRHE
jgi:hypothetical protein